MGVDKKVSYLMREDPGVQASGTVEVAVQPTATNTLTINGTVITFVAGTAVGSQVQIGANKAATATALLAFLQASLNANIALMTYTKVGDVITAKAKIYRTAGNAYTLATSNAVAFTLSGATLAGGGASPSVVSSSTNISVNRAVWTIRTEALGKWLRYEGCLRWSGNGNDAGAFRAFLPTGLQFDPARIAGLTDGSSDQESALIGHCRFYNNGVGIFPGSVVAADATSARFTTSIILTGDFFENNDSLLFVIDCPVKNA